MGYHMENLGQGQLTSGLKAFAQRGLLHLVMSITRSKSTAGFHGMVEVILASRVTSVSMVPSRAIYLNMPEQANLVLFRPIPTC